MFSSAFVCLSAGLCKNYSTDYHKIQWKGGKGTWKKPPGFGGNPDHVTLG